MKTNQVLTRKMGEFDVLQRTSDGMFNATGLLKQWNTYSAKKKDLDDFLSNKATKEYITIIKSKEYYDTQNSGDDRESLKSVFCTSRANKGINAGTWMHPFLFIDFAMWLNPEFKYNVIKFVHDKLVEYRNEAGDSYRILSSAVSQIVSKEEMPKAMSSIAKALNYVIYNNHEKQLRNKQADELLLKDMTELQKDIAKFINFGFINSYEQLRNFLQKRWIDKWNNNLILEPSNSYSYNNQTSKL